MDEMRFDTMTRLLSQSLTRRGMCFVAGGSALALGMTGSLQLLSARKKRRKNKKNLKRNAFGCVGAGDPCRGNGTNCCSGICQGKKPKRGMKDKSRCADHNAGDCTPERDICLVGGIEESLCNGEPARAFCVTTTGGASFCASDENVSPEINCVACRTDRDCEALGFPSGSACVVLVGGICVAEQSCVGINGSDGTACLAPGV
jgi:hypothetical protein